MAQTRWDNLLTTISTWFGGSVAAASLSSPKLAKGSNIVGAKYASKQADPAYAAEMWTPFAFGTSHVEMASVSVMSRLYKSRKFL